MRIVIIGATGQLGGDLAEVLCENTIYAPTRDDLDITNKNLITSYLENTNPEVVINTAAFHNVLNCEENPEEAFSVNAKGPGVIARVCNDLESKFFHMSTDYVFDGELGRPLREDDEATPLMVYGASKLAGEHLVAANCANSYIVRTTGLFGKHPCRARPDGRNFVKTMLHLAQEKGEVKVVGDQQCCPTYTHDLAIQIKAMIDSDIAPGIYHAVTPPGLSWADFTRLIFQKVDLDVNIVECRSDELKAPFRRPSDSRLENSALISQGILIMRELDEALHQYLAEISELAE